MLTDHFSLEEMVASQTASRARVDNTPSEGDLFNLRRLAVVLESARSLVGPIIISSGYRSPALNAMVGGNRHSAHMRGLAADFICPSFGSPFAVARRIMQSEMMDEVDQLILEFNGWVHLAITEEGLVPRQKVLTIRSAAEGYQSGLMA